LALTRLRTGLVGSSPHHAGDSCISGQRPDWHIVVLRRPLLDPGLVYWASKFSRSLKTSWKLRFDPSGWLIGRLTPEKRSWLVRCSQTKVSGYGANGLDRIGTGSIAGKQNIKVGKVALLEAIVEITDFMRRRFGTSELIVSCVITYVHPSTSVHAPMNSKYVGRKWS
jgi:hypothetical protein